MDYKVKYEEALERAKQLSKELTVDDIIEQIFPELAESKDEKIRKMIINTLNREKNLTEDEVYDCVAWLEKQGEQKWSEEDLICLGYLADFVDKNGDDFYGKNKPNVVKWIRSFVELPTHISINEIGQKPEWSEEDRKMMRNIIDDIHCGTNFNPEVMHAANEREKWFKSICLRLQSRWKPSDGQIDAISVAVRNMKNSACYDSELVHLLQDLKQLKEG